MGLAAVLLYIAATAAALSIAAWVKEKPATLREFLNLDSNPKEK